MPDDQADAPSVEGQTVAVDDYDSDGSSDMTEVNDAEIPDHFEERDRRLFHSHGDLPYPLPADGHEQRRLKMQHRLLRALVGANYFGPVVEVLSPSSRRKRVLDLGTGTGTWVQQMAAEFPHVTFIGCDIVPIASRYPRNNVQFHICDFTRHLRDYYEDNSFDVVHARCVSLGIRDYPALIREVGRILRPGGLFLSGEWIRFPRPSGPNLDLRIRFPYSCDFMALLAHVLDQRRGIRLLLPSDVNNMLQRSGTFVDVNTTQYSIPIGTVNHDRSLRALGTRQSEMLAIYAESMRSFLQRDSGLSVERIQDLIAGFTHELRNGNGMMADYQATYARKL